jgi:hypothetical protein
VTTSVGSVEITLAPGVGDVVFHPTRPIESTSKAAEQIVAAELTTFRVVDGRPVPGTGPGPCWRGYNQEVAAARRVAFVFTVWPSDLNRPERRRAMTELETLGFQRERFANLILFLPPVPTERH